MEHAERTIRAADQEEGKGNYLALCGGNGWFIASLNANDLLENKTGSEEGSQEVRNETTDDALRLLGAHSLGTSGSGWLAFSNDLVVPLDNLVFLLDGLLAFLDDLVVLGYDLLGGFVDSFVGGLLAFVVLERFGYLLVLVRNIQTVELR